MSLIKKHQIKAIIFDHDGTLVDSEPVHLNCWQKVLDQYDVKIDLATYRRYLSGIPSASSAAWLAETYQIAEKPASLLSQKIQFLQAFLAEQNFPLCSGAKEVVSHLNQQFPLAVASGARRHEVQNSVTNHGLSAYFKVICTQDDVEHNKPAPDVYLLAAQQLGVEPEHCLAIEDSDPGQQSALAAGMPCIRIVDKNGPTTSLPGTLINELPEILELL